MLCFHCCHMADAGVYYFRILQSLAYIKNNNFVKVFFAFCAVFYIFISPAAFLTPLQVTRSFGDDVWRLTAIEVTFATGMMLGGILLTSWGGFRNKAYTIALSCLTFGLTTVALGVVPWFWLYLAFMTLTGLAVSAFNSPAIALLQQKVEGEYQGRVFGVLGMIQSAVMPLSTLVFGPLADVIRIEWLLIGTGMIIAIMGGMLFGNRTLVEAGKPVPEQPE